MKFENLKRFEVHFNHGSIPIESPLNDNKSVKLLYSQN
jgi:hypothetical protein